MSEQEQLLKSLAPLMAGNRLNNLVDLLALAADMLEMTDSAMVEKLAGVFEDVVTVGWEGGTALRMAWEEQINREGDISLRQVFAALNDPDTRRGIMLLLRVLQITGQRLNSLSSVSYSDCPEIMS
ncbi:hypothetical protein ABR32_02520 [Enterobacter cloacae subsp. dissolvens]|uniref:DUF1641 domain-containing protein n=1 Tax=Enterobacter cloacae TaxID=550 RepID=UPI0006434D95|nr:DUF1641 domain-containing protein [Enterobacter cloacae]KLQ43823.1 hypothetical protein ABR32_02520 [Enterobacter cloacae subsp. dissolvens]